MICTYAWWAQVNFSPIIFQKLNYHRMSESRKHPSFNVTVAKEAPYEEDEVIDSAIELKEDSALIEGKVF